MLLLSTNCDIPGIDISSPKASGLMTISPLYPESVWTYDIHFFSLFIWLVFAQLCICGVCSTGFVMDLDLHYRDFVVNDARCPECARSIRVNMSRHLRLSPTVCQCFWRCQVPTCPMWFASELNGKDHLERIHNFTEGRGYSFYDCLWKFGLEWFGRRSFFDQREETGQALWMDLALARYSGQELHNNYVLTTSPAFGNLRKLFRAAIRDLVLAYNDYPGASVAPAT